MSSYPSKKVLQGEIVAVQERGRERLKGKLLRRELKWENTTNTEERARKGGTEGGGGRSQ